MIHWKMEDTLTAELILPIIHAGCLRFVWNLGHFIYLSLLHLDNPDQKNILRPSHRQL
jgi:hypothetical protein